MTTPRFIVFYNGMQQQPDYKQLYLSESYIANEEEVCLELKVDMYNINLGHNQALLETCKTLGDYAEYVHRIRGYANDGIPIEQAVDRAIDECIEEGILKEFLEKQRAEAKAMSIYEYDYEKHLKMEREEHFENGKHEKLKELVGKKLEKNCTVADIADMLEESEDTIKKIIVELSSSD